MSTFFFRPVTRHRGGNLWEPIVIQNFANVAIGASSAVISPSLPPSQPAFSWKSEDLAGRTHRLQMVSAGVAGDMQVVGKDSFTPIITSFAVVDTQVLDLTIAVPANESGWLVASAAGGLSAGTLNITALTDTTANETAINQDTQRRSKVAGDTGFLANRRGTVFANRIR